MVTQIAVTGDFSETDNCVGAGSGIAVGASCAVQVTFLPTTTGARSGLLTVYGNVAGGQATAASDSVWDCLRLTVILNPICCYISFGANVGSTSGAQNISISNTGTMTATLQARVVTGDFAITADTCGATLAPDVGCTVSVVFRPTASGTRTGGFSISDSVGTQTASLTGVGVLPATDSLSPSSLTFAAQQLTTTSATQQVTLTNSGDAALTLVAGQITSGDFTVVNSCGNSLSGHSSCSMLVAFVPKNLGATAGVLTVTDKFRAVQTIALEWSFRIAPLGVSVAAA